MCFCESYSPLPYVQLEIEGKIGAGAFGVVSKANWRGTLVAVKHLADMSEENTQNFEVLQKPLSLDATTALRYS